MHRCGHMMLTVYVLTHACVASYCYVRTHTHTHTHTQAKKTCESTTTTEMKIFSVPDEAQDSSDSEDGEPLMSRPPGGEGEPTIPYPPGEGEPPISRPPGEAGEQIEEYVEL